MSYKISKELFEAVYNEDYLLRIEVGTYSIVAYLTDGAEFTENIDTFFFACKEWAYNQGYDMLSGGLEAGLHSCYIDYSDKRYTLSMKPINHFFAESEQQAVFDACQWILDKDKQ